MNGRSENKLAESGNPLEPRVPAAFRGGVIVVFPVAGSGETPARATLWHALASMSSDVPEPANLDRRTV